MKIWEFILRIISMMIGLILLNYYKGLTIAFGIVGIGLIFKSYFGN